jgi:hypothetical protein
MVSEWFGSFKRNTYSFSHFQVFITSHPMQSRHLVDPVYILMPYLYSSDTFLCSLFWSEPLINHGEPVFHLNNEIYRTPRKQSHSPTLGTQKASNKFCGHFFVWQRQLVTFSRPRKLASDRFDMNLSNCVFTFLRHFKPYSSLDLSGTLTFFCFCGRIYIHGKPALKREHHHVYQAFIRV